jgi:hypothetical protein
MRDNLEGAYEDQQGENSKEQEQYDRKICPWLKDLSMYDLSMYFAAWGPNCRIGLICKPILAHISLPATPSVLSDRSHETSPNKLLHFAPTYYTPTTDTGMRNDAYSHYNANCSWFTNK